MGSLLTAVFGLVALPVLSAALSAAPARLITSPPVVKTGNPNTGPLIDPGAVQGQWFQRPTGLQEVRPYEFYDNVVGEGGGAAGTSAIKGSVLNPQFLAGVGSPLIGFDIRATITNDLPGVGIGQPGTNSHDEVLAPTASAPFTYQGTMYDVKLTSEFALPANVPQGVLGQIAAGQPPYNTPPNLITSKNEDQLAWFCYTPVAGAVGGNYIVPTWDFGNIAPGASATRTLTFTTNILPTDPSYPFYLAAIQDQRDVLMNRTTDLKIGDWVDQLATDTGAAYPVPSLRSGDASVFFNVPEPSTLMVLGGIGVSMAVRRRAR